ncbi:MAG: DUF982 domain-containing protein [Neoaquamicrobium sediminum]|uniref:DUF982 domain-containing protein n=1 Tax=Neoaquamicrobium sediminum TaxID=1849104 RepID=UPI001D40B595|nr:DUF982 domain-containing protein [Mesorhizobium sp.]
MKDWWDEPVRVVISDRGIRDVERLEKAAEMLLAEWPEQNGPAYINAKEALTKALQDPSSDSARAAARMAFAAAADEAGILRE